ncbi:MAG: hypothetical protein ONB16_00595 [candidate division KSB1 bacterium]|nr:hypothetical protein [candidate division KSB1 bacterium]MDZ7317775.1 hypothetical protein [candidate division KSB1 bacterium]MDZ7339955.1 hypothetical protein [candidate division KSB1 bacterium]
MNKQIFEKKRMRWGVLIGVIIFALNPFLANAQFAVKWLAVGSLHNWYSEIGSEIEHGNLKVQQCGMQWEGIYRYQDMQAAKAFWIGCKNFTDEKGVFYPYKVVHVGPRVTGANEFFPVKFEMYSRFEPPKTTVDLIETYEKRVDNDGVDPTLKADRMILNITNNQIGITTTRKIMQFSHPYHDNYIICEYTFTNTGNVDDDPEIELPNQTLEDVYFFFQFRWAVCRETRYLIGNATGWGINLMLDARGDGVMPDPPNEQFRAQFGWHGKYPPFTQYDNLGAPIWNPAGSAGYIGSADTVGRLGSAQFIGVVTLHADRSATDPTDDPGQPSTTTYESSDAPNTSQNDPYNVARMESEYGWMSKGHMSPRHAWKVEPSGNFAEPTGDPALGTPGGFSACNGYGPYTLRPGESVRIVWAEAAAGLSREKCIEIGKQFKTGQISAKTKNEWVLSGRDSLFQTFRRAIANYQSGYAIQQPPKPPSVFRVNGGGDRIMLNWEVYEENDPERTGFEIYRAKGQYDSTYQLIHRAGPDERSFNDTVLERGVSYFYYIVSTGNEIPADPTLNIPADILRSSRYYTQTYDPTNLKRPAGESLSQIRVVPNPYNISADPNRLLFPGESDKLAFYNIPGQCTIKIYTETGELIKTIEHTDGSGDAYWSCTTEYQQIVVSGVYIAVVTDNVTGQSQVVKFLIIR